MNFSHLSHFLLTVTLASVTACTTTDIVNKGIIGPTVGPINKPEGEVKASSPTRKDTLGSGERVEVFVKEDTSFNGIYPIRKNGDIIIAKIGRINLNGLTTSEAENKIKQALEKGQLNAATVIVDHLESNKPTTAGSSDSTSDTHLNIYLTGLVNQPGAHRIPKRDTSTVGAYETILISGGLSRFADERKSHILRLQDDGSRKKIQLDLEAIQSGSKADVAVRDHDILVIPERIFGF